MISEPRNNSPSLQPLRNLNGIIWLWILPHTKHLMSPLPIYTVPGMIPACCTHHPSPTTKNHKRTAYRACCVRDRVSSSHKHDSSSTTTTIETTAGTPQQQHSSSTAAAQQQKRWWPDVASAAQQQKRWWPDVAGDSVRARFQKYRQTAKLDLPIQNKTNFPKSEAIVWWTPQISDAYIYFWSLKNYKNKCQK